MVSNGKKVIIILFIFDAIISGLIAYSPSGAQALTGWLVLNLIIIFPAILIRFALTRRKRKSKGAKEIHGSLNYFEGSIYDPKSQTWKVPARDSTYVKHEEPNGLGNSDASQTITHESESSHNTATKSREEPQYADASTLASIKTTGSKISHLSDMGGLLAQGFSKIAQENECVLLRKNLGSQTDNEKLVYERATYALVIGEQLLWKESFERPIAESLSSKGKVGVIWERTLISSSDHLTANSGKCYLTILDSTGHRIAEFDLPFPAYAIAISGDLAIVATAFPDNSIRCYDIRNSELKWKVENMTGQTVTQLEVHGDKVYVCESLGDAPLFTLSLEGDVASDSTGLYATAALMENLRTALSGVAEVKFGWNERRDFPMPLVSVMKLDGIPDQIDINIWSHTSNDKITTTRIVSNVLEGMRDKIIVQGMEDITNEEDGILDPVSWKVVQGSKPVFRKLISAKIVTRHN